MRARPSVAHLLLRAYSRAPDPWFAEAIPRWTFEFADGRDRCARRTGGDLYVVLTALVLVGGVIVCVVCAVQAYRQRESTAGYEPRGAASALPRS
jgi:heme/copper-type cytochrome/quinol oxidase subunit 2